MVLLVFSYTYTNFPLHHSNIIITFINNYVITGVRISSILIFRLAKILPIV